MAVLQVLHQVCLSAQCSVTTPVSPTSLHPITRTLIIPQQEAGTESEVVSVRDHMDMNFSDNMTICDLGFYHRNFPLGESVV